MHKPTRRSFYFVSLLGLMTLTLAFSAFLLLNPRTQVSANTVIPTLSASELSAYNGDSPDKPIYLALDGNIYDVTAGKKFYEPGGDYHYLAGRDSSEDLKMFGAEIIKRKYPIVAYLESGI